MTAVFLGAERRLRAGWRIVLELAGFSILSILVGSMQRVAVERRDLSTYVLGLLGGLGLAWAYGRWIDRREFVAYGFRTDRAWWIDLGAGVEVLKVRSSDADELP
jgi:hypothetical protein